MFPPAVLVTSLGLAAALVVVVVGGAAVPEDRIINGHQISFQEAPFIVALIRNETQFCGGAIIGDRWVLTAAHCASDEEAPALSVRIGSANRWKGGAVYKVAQVINHENFTKLRVSDISLLKTKKPMVLKDPVRPVRLPKIGSRRPPVNTVVRVIGWGWMEDKTRPNLLRAVDIFINDYEKCESLGADHPQTEICAGAPGKGAFGGDSGGPLVRGDVQVGVVSWGAGEVDAKIPSIYTDVAYHRRWIKEQTGI